MEIFPDRGKVKMLNVKIVNAYKWLKFLDYLHSHPQQVSARKI